MKFNKKTFACLAIALVIGALAGFWAINGEWAVGDRAESRKVQRVKTSSVVRTGANSKKITEISLEERDGKRSVRIMESDIVRPDVSVDDDDDEAKLTPQQRAALKELQSALDDDDLKAVRRALEKMIAMRTRALEALGWFGKDAVNDLVPFLADSNVEVSNDAFEKFQLAISECDDDVEKSVIVKTMMRAISDAEQIDTMLNNLNDMRNSVRAETIASILTDGTDNARRIMMEQLGEYTDSDVETVDDLERWVVENPDESDADEIYGERSGESESE